MAKKQDFPDLEKSTKNPKQKKMGTGGYEGIDKAIFQWFLAKKSQNVPIFRLLLKKKALDFAKQLE